ncbi:MAG: T9SS type A sorting domain-containing protein [Chitinophagaceae bacterium]|nr:T9SS type A sorting domain-containing protein [Chitinophagaceae bacterium]
MNFLIKDINGRTLKTWSANFSSGYASLPINIQGFNAGVYFMVVQGTDFTDTKKFVKQ